MDALGSLLHGFWLVIGPNLGWFIAIGLGLTVLRFPAPGRGPRSSARDPWRTFRFAARAEVLKRAGGRCEAPFVIAWGRCPEPAAEIDLDFPWSKGGPTIVSNAQALCSRHNRSKGALTPPWRYVLGLEQRRRGYAPPGAPARIHCAMAAEEAEARRQWQNRRGRS